ncbi:uncharacterized protein LOC143625576 [Bidens hawaiensis]|uniref:uncharacterized protein LOC143625576 n=1 Tax=Bidens hawaiensis TaxID=980011 RepID=UPI0040497085
MAHINVEYCGWSMLIKYLFKYISKGVDRVRYTITSTQCPTDISPQQLSRVNEIQNFLDGRFICPHEASWRIFNFRIHERNPAIQSLAVHLENMQNITFRDNDLLHNVSSNTFNGRTTLTAWLHNNNHDSSGHHLQYIDYVTEYSWKPQSKSWVRRSLDTEPTIGRLIYIHPSSGKTFYLRMLLGYQKGCQSYACIRTVNGHCYPTFRQACEALGLLGDDKEWSSAIDEASCWASASEIRALFVQMLLYCDLSNPLELLNKHLQKIGDDGQRQQTLCFVYGHGGTGKTFLWTTIIAALHSTGKIVLAVSASGIASLLLPSGRTTHSRFKIPLDMTNESTCNIKKNTQLAQLMNETTLIIWDEAPMSDKKCFETLNRSLRDIFNNNHLPFGGRSMLLGGDFRQILPIVPKAPKTTIIASSLPRSHLWPHFKVFKLTENMRLHRPNLTNQQRDLICSFSSWLVDVGDRNIGTVDPADPNTTKTIEIPAQYLVPYKEGALTDLIKFIYDNETLEKPSATTLSSKAIVCPKNETVNELNSSILAITPEMANIRICDIKGQKPGIITVRVLKQWISKGRRSELCYLLVDENGDAIDAIADLHNRSHFESLIQVQSCYKITDYVAIRSRRSMSVTSHAASIQIGLKAEFELISNDTIPKCYYDIVNHDVLKQRLGSWEILTDHVNVKALPTSSFKQV